MKRRGSVLLLLLFSSLVVTMLGTALFKLYFQSMRELGLRRDRQQALQWARAGLNHGLHRLTYMPAWSSDLDSIVDGQGYRLTFSGGAYRSVNNLQGIAIAPLPNYRGEPVPAQSADLVIEGRSGRSTVRLHTLVQHGLQFQRSLGALGRVRIAGDCEIRGIRSFADPVDCGGGILSKYEMTAAGDWAIEKLAGPGALVSGATATLEALPQPNSWQAISPNLHAAVPAAIRENSADTPLPEFDVAELMSPHLGDPPPDGLAGGNLPTTVIQDSRCVSGDLTVTGDLVFSNNGALYVNGNLVLNGGVIGEGVIYCSGDVQILGGSSSLITNQGNGAALFAGGDVVMQGQSAVGYLNALGTTYPAIGTRWTDVRNKLNQIKTTLDTAPDPDANPGGANSAASSLWGMNWELSKKEVNVSHPEYNAGVTVGQNWISSIPSPNGTYADAGSDALLPALIDEIRNSMGTAYNSDPQAQRIVHALEETHYYFRHNRDTCRLDPGAQIVNNRLVGSATAVNDWDDLLLDPLHWSFEHGVIEAWPWGAPQPDKLKNFFAGLSAFFDQHPMDFSWLGSSNFQGIVYCQGNATISNEFQIVGLVLSGGEVHLTGGSRLIFNEEYLRQGGINGPLRCLFVHEM